MRFSIIMPVYNSESTIRESLISIRQQSFKDYELIIMDGISKDSSLDIIQEFNDLNIKLYSQRDKNLYDAINKGINLAIGDYVGILHSDDCFYNQQTLYKINRFIKSVEPSPKVIYGNLEYYNCSMNKKLYYWKSDYFSKNKFKKGWMPPHPTIFIKNNIIKYQYDTTYNISADYKWILQTFNSLEEAEIQYLDNVITKMRSGGVSSDSFASIKTRLKQNYKILQEIYSNPLRILILKMMTAAIRKYF